MAVTVAFQGNPTPLSVTMVATHDGNAGNSVTLANATIVAALTPGPLLELLSRVYSSQAVARDAILEAQLSVQDGDPVSHGMDAIIIPRVGVAGCWAVDVNIDGGGLPTIDVSLGVQATAVAVVRLSYRYSATR